MAAAAIHLGDLEDQKLSLSKEMPEDKQVSMAGMIGFRDKLKEKIGSVRFTEKPFDVVRTFEKAAGDAKKPFDKAATDVQKGFQTTSENIAWGAAQAHYRAALMTGIAGPPVEPFMSKEQEQRARMAALFKAVDPSKLEILDELVEKRKVSKNAFGFRKNGFDQMWKSYKQKFGAKAVDDAFKKVKEEQKGFYRAKTLALFAAANPPGNLPEVDSLMAKHDGKYDEMFKLWVSTKKFDTQAIAVAHATAMQQIEK
jgi:hypothetical protein